MRWVPNRATRDGKSTVVQLDLQWADNPIHHTHVIFCLCHGINNLWSLYIYSVEVLCGFQKHTTWSKSANYMAKINILHDHVVCHYISHDPYKILYRVICQRPWHNDFMEVTLWSSVRDSKVFRECCILHTPLVH